MKLWVSGIVAARDKQPYLVLSKDEMSIGQLTMQEARHLANEMLIQCSRAEADAMIHKFFSKNEFPPGAGAELMMDFRDFRADLDGDTERHDPDRMGDASQ